MTSHGRSALASIIALALLLMPARALADLSLGADLDLLIGRAGGTAQVGGGVLGRLGWRTDAGPFHLTLEGGGGVSSIGAIDSATHVLGGARIGSKGPLQLSVYGHAGYGWFAEGVRGRSHDVGAAFDIAVLPLINFGVHGGYRFNGPVLDWVPLGVHATLIL